MLPPVQNQDLLQRSDTMSNLRSQEQGKFFGDLAKSAAEMQRLENLKDNTVQKDDESEALNPDGSSGNEQEQQNKKKQQEEETSSETGTPAGRPLKIEGGDILDIMA